MTRDEAQEFLKRNPRIARKMDEYRDLVRDGAESIYALGEASSETDAKVNIVDVVNATGGPDGDWNAAVLD